MPRTRKPERYPPEFFEAALAAQRAGGLEIPADSVAEAFGLRTKFYAFFAALDSQADAGPAALSRRLVAAQRIPEAPGEGSSAWALSCASDLLAAAANLEASVETVPTVRLVLTPKSNNKFARMIRAALDAKQPSVEDSLARLRGLVGGQEDDSRGTD